MKFWTNIKVGSCLEKMRCKRLFKKKSIAYITILYVNRIYKVTELVLQSNYAHHVCVSHDWTKVRGRAIVGWGGDKIDRLL